MTQSPLERYQLKQQMKQSKKSDKSGLYILVGSVMLLVIVLAVVMKMRSGDAPTPRTPTRVQTAGDVDLSDSRQKQLYIDWCELGGMGSPESRRLQILNERYGVSRTQALQIIDKGQRQGWSRGDAD